MCCGQQFYNGEQQPMTDLVAKARVNWPGVCLAATLAMAASFLSMRYGAPAMLMGLLLGLAFHFLMENPRVVPGIELSATQILRLGVALLGLRITFTDLIELGWLPVAGVCVGVLLTIAFGTLCSRIMGLGTQLGVLTGGSVGICGASAAMAISSVLPGSDKLKQETLFTVIGVTTLSTMAMVVYPLITHALNLNETEAGIFIGATIHDVAQVVGAGYSISSEVGDLSTFVKLLRVAMLVPVVLCISLFVRQRVRAGGTQSALPIPWFLVGFVVLFMVNSLSLLPKELVAWASGGASWLLLTAIAALGVRTSLKNVAGVGVRPIILMVLETVFLALLALGFILLT